MPTYDYRCEANQQVYEVKHAMSHPVSTWKELCEAAGIDPGDIAPDTKVTKLIGASGVVKRVIEIAFGFEHYPQFRVYLASGGIMGILQRTQLDENIVHHERYSQDGNQIVMIAHRSPSGGTC